MCSDHFGFEMLRSPLPQKSEAEQRNFSDHLPLVTEYQIISQWAILGKCLTPSDSGHCWKLPWVLNEWSSKGHFLCSNQVKWDQDTFYPTGISSGRSWWPREAGKPTRMYSQSQQYLGFSMQQDDRRGRAGNVGWELWRQVTGQYWQGHHLLPAFPSLFLYLGLIHRSLTWFTVASPDFFTCCLHLHQCRVHSNQVQK